MTDTIRAVFTYAIALIVVVGGGSMLYLLRGDVSATDLRTVVAGFIGSALTFAFGAEVATRTARQSAASTAAGTAAAVATVAGNGGHPPP